MPEQDHYAVLGIVPGADPRAVALAYRRAVRRTHPDMGGSAEAFAAVQEAWRVLGDPAERADYDAPRDDWAVDGWGVAIDEPSADADGGARPDADRGDDRPSRSGDGAGRRRPDVGSPFASGAIDLPEPELRAPRPARMSRAGWPDRSLEAVLLLSGVGVVVIVLAAGVLIEGLAYGAAAFVVLLAGYCLWADRVVGTRTPWPVMLFSVGLAVAMVIGSVELASSAASALLTDLTVGLVAVCARLVLAKRRASYGESRSRDAVRVGRSIAQHELAAEWNVLREALCTPGTTVERLLESRALGGSWRCTFLDPLTMGTSARVLDTNLREGTWAVFDRAGEVLATAPAGAPDAWKRVLRRER